MSSKVLQWPDPCLTNKVEEVNIARTSVDELKEWFDLMVDALDWTIENGRAGIAIAANQVGINKSIFVHLLYHAGPTAVINPVIRPLGNPKQVTDFEGCLSLPDKIAIRPLRHEKISVDYWEYPSLIKYENRELSGYHAQVFQHEYDHLRGYNITSSFKYRRLD